MSWLRNAFLFGLFSFLLHAAGADVMVQLNINRPINDVSDKFISFSIKPEDLYKALDSSNRKTITRMASMLSHSHIKFVGDYYFAAKTEGIRLRNPTKIIWKGFNKWTKAVNWSMIIPVPYKPDHWDPMETLNILNTSQMVDIDEVIWQLGTDFGTSRAADYVNELRTFNIMVDSFKNTVVNWQTMGADISGGSSPEETLRYIEMSRDLNVAYGWIQSDDLFLGNSVDSPLEGQDPALQTLFKSKVPVWWTLPKKKPFSLRLEDDVIDGLQWSQTMGEAAHMGFDTIFKPLTLDDIERPNFSFYATVLFKKIMGSRVYPARHLNLYSSNNKLYTHCASMVSGGLSLMIVNTLEQPLHFSIRTMNKIQDNEVWQYSLTLQNGHVMLNDNKLFINSTMTPEVRRKNTRFMLQLIAPALSVSFWVLPNANLDHCHFTEIHTPFVPDEFNNKIKRYSSSDRLLKELIKETTKQTSLSPLASLLSRHRRSLDNDDRLKRFVLEDSKNEAKKFFNQNGNSVQDIKPPPKREIFKPEHRSAAIDWLSNIFKKPLNFNMPLLRRNVRQSDLLKGPIFRTRDGKKIAFTRKIPEIKKPAKKNKKIHSEDQEFDEEKYFKTVDEPAESEYVRIPEGDVLFRHIVSVDGDEDEITIKTRRPKMVSRVPFREIVSEMKPLRLLPAEYFEALPVDKPNIGSSYFDTLGKPFEEDALTKAVNSEVDTSEADEPATAEIDMKHKITKNKSTVEKNAQSTEKDNEGLLEAKEETSLENKKSLSTDNLNSLADPLKSESDKCKKCGKRCIPKDNSNDKNYNEGPEWNLSGKRIKRAIDTVESRNSWQDNMISKDDDRMTAANELTPARLLHFEHKVDEIVRDTNGNAENKIDEEADELSLGDQIVNTFKDHVTKFVDYFSHHANEWYNAFTKQLDSVLAENAAIEENRVA